MSAKVIKGEVIETYDFLRRSIFLSEIEFQSFRRVKSAALKCAVR